MYVKKFIAISDIGRSQLLSQNGYVPKSLPNRISEARRAAGLSQQALADRVGVHWVTISKLERGRIKLTTKWMEKLAPALGVEPTDLMNSTKSLPTGVNRLDALWDNDENLFQPRRPEAAKIEGDVVLLQRPGAFWIEILGGEREPLLHHGDKVQVVPIDEASYRSQAEGRLGLIELNGTDTVGFVYRGSKPGTWDLFWLAGRLLHNVEADKVALVTAIIRD